MEESVEILLRENSVEQLKEGGTGIAAVLWSELLLNSKAIEDLLLSYYFRSRGRVFDLKFDQSSLQVHEATEATFEVMYKIGIFNACADIDSDYSEKMTITIKIEPEAGKLILTGEFFPEREPDEL